MKVPDVSKAFLTQKMTAAKAVESSVTFTNSLSEDYTNLDESTSTNMSRFSQVQTIYFKLWFLEMPIF